MRFNTATFRMQESQKLRHNTSQFFDLFLDHNLVDKCGAAIDINDQIDFMPTCNEVNERFYHIRRKVLLQIIKTLNKQFLITPFGIGIENLISSINELEANSVVSHFDFHPDKELQSIIQYYPQNFGFFKSNCQDKAQVASSQNGIFEIAYTGQTLTSSRPRKPAQLIKHFRRHNYTGITIENFLTSFMYNKQYHPDKIQANKEVIFETVSITDQCNFLMEITQQKTLHIFPISPRSFIPKATTFRHKIDF